MNVIGEIAAERRRQIEREGWTAEHDDEHVDGSLAAAAACYALPKVTNWRIQRDRHDVGRSVDEEIWNTVYTSVPLEWPESWHGTHWKPKDRRRDLVRAAALIVAEIERIDRSRGERE